jgi:hypothetical protein
MVGRLGVERGVHGFRVSDLLAQRGFPEHGGDLQPSLVQHGLLPDQGHLSRPVTASVCQARIRAGQVQGVGLGLQQGGDPLRLVDQQRDAAASRAR